MKLDVDRLIMLHVHKVERCATGSDQRQVGLVSRVIESSKISIINAETILPDVKNSLLGFGSGGADWTERIRNAATLNTITT
jgi:hypothetical protein